MALPAVIAGLLEVSVQGKTVRAKGAWTYGINPTKREMLIGADFIHGFMEKPQACFIEGEVTDAADLNLINDLFNVGATAAEATVAIRLRNKKTIYLRNAVFTGTGEAKTEEGNISVRFDGTFGEEVPS